MIAKKSKKADLERKRFAFFQIGLLVAGSLSLAAFEYTTVTYQEKLTAVQFYEGDYSTEVPIEIVEVEPEIPQPKMQVFTLDTDTILEIEDILVAESFIVDSSPIDMGDISFDPSDGIDMGVGGLGDETEYEFPEIEPKFVGGPNAMNEWISKNVDYPELAREIGMTGTVYVSFVVEKDGSISKVTTLNRSEDGVHQDFIIEGKRVVGKMPKWIPGENMGKKVRARFTLPIKFTSH